jgi:allantoin racemase
VKIKLIVPRPLDQGDEAALASRFPPDAIGPSIEIAAVGVERATRLGDEYEETLRAVAVVAAGADAEEDGFDAVVIDSVLDPGLYALRSRLSIPVVGPGLAAYSVALTLGLRFSILSLDPDARRGFERTLRLYGLEDKCASVRPAPDFADETLSDDAAGLRPALLAEGRAAVTQDRAEVIVLGATHLHGTARELAQALECPVLDPGVIAIQIAERLRLLGLSHSKAAFPAPKRIQDAKLLGLLTHGQAPGPAS